MKDKAPLPKKKLRAKLPYHSSLQSTLGMLGQGIDLEETLTNGKYVEGLIYTP